MVTDNPTDPTQEVDIYDLNLRLHDIEVSLGLAATAGAIDVVAVGATSTAVLAAGAGRQRVVLTNISDERIDVAVGATAAAAKGIALAPGASVVLTPAGGCRLAINAICASGGKNLSVQTLSTA